jgi:hypothetical protein
MRCPSCGARNREGADWCTQCYEPMPADGAAPAASGPDPAASGSAPAASGPPPAPPVEEVAVPTGGYSPREELLHAAEAATREVEPTQTSDPRFRRTSEGLDWRCEVCESWNPIEVLRCRSCGQPFARTVGDEEPEPSSYVSESTALVASMLLPGLGHVLMKRTATGVGRAILYSTWVVGGALLLVSAIGAGQAALPAIPLLLGALIIWAGSLYDTLHLHRGSGTELLRPRILLWLAVVVIGMLLLSFLGSALTVAPRTSEEAAVLTGL